MISASSVLFFYKLIILNTYICFLFWKMTWIQVPAKFDLNSIQQQCCQMFVFLYSNNLSFYLTWKYFVKEKQKTTVFKNRRSVTRLRTTSKCRKTPFLGTCQTQNTLASFESHVGAAAFDNYEARWVIKLQAQIERARSRVVVTRERTAPNKSGLAARIWLFIVPVKGKSIRR